MANPVIHLLGQLILERPTRKRSLAELAHQLDDSGAKILARMSKVADTPANRQQAGHIIGMERWGQQRLRVFLGEALHHDEYDGYRPADQLQLNELSTAFQQTRQETVRLARQAASANLAAAQVLHNSLGDLSLRAWLRYLDLHAWLESQRLR